MPLQALVQVATVPSGDAAARGLGALLGVALLALGIAKCIAISRRPTTNGKTTVALALVLGAWLTLQMTSFLRAFALPPLLYLLLLPLVLLSALAGVVLAIVGLIEMKRRPDGFLQGRAQGWWSVALGGLFVLSSLVALGSLAATPVQRSILADVELPRAEATTASFEDLNFRFTPPDRSWAKMEDITRLNPDATIAICTPGRR